MNISTALTLSPHTVLQSSYGVSVLQLARMQKERPDRALNALLRAITRTNKPSLTTRKLVMQTFGAFVPSNDLDAALHGKEPTTPHPWQSDWEILQEALGEPGDDALYQLVARLGRLDRMVFSARKLTEKGMQADGEALLAPYIGRSFVERWKRYNPNLSMPVAVLLDISLQSLAWLEWRAKRAYPGEGAVALVSRFVCLLAPRRRPIGHWLMRMQKSVGCASLLAFSSRTLDKGIKWHSRQLSHDLLKKWSSGQQLMPAKALQPVLKVVSGHVNDDRERNLFAAARFLSFLCDLVIAGSRGKPPSWAAAQDQIRRQYGELYELEAVRTIAP